MGTTVPALIYRRTKNLPVLLFLLGDTKPEGTVRFPGIEIDDTLEMAKKTEVRSRLAGLTDSRLSP